MSKLLRTKHHWLITIPVKRHKFHSAANKNACLLIKKSAWNGIIYYFIISLVLFILQEIKGHHKQMFRFKRENDLFVVVIWIDSLKNYPKFIHEIISIMLKCYVIVLVIAMLLHSRCLENRNRMESNEFQFRAEVT